MIIYYQGAELPTYRNLIKEMNIQSSSLSYMGLRKRTKFSKPWLVKNYFPEGHRLFVDSGCSVLNNAKEQLYDDDELRRIAEHYYQWIDSNISDLEYYTEFDAVQLGPGSIEAFREQRRDIAYDKLVPVWHSDSGLSGLHYLAEEYGRVGISQTSLGGRDLIPTLSRLAARGVALHGLAMTKPDIMQAVKWESVSSTSWTTPQRYGDTIIWSHNQLKRYPKSMKDQARKKERATFLSSGFDWEKIQQDDPKEMLRISLWSWEQLLNKINKTPTGVTTSMDYSDEEFSEVEGDAVGTVVPKPPNRVPTAKPRDPSQRKIVPFLDFDIDTIKVKNNETGEYENKDVPRVKIRSESMRVCDTCFLAAKCPMFEPNSTCAYDMPIQVETKEQMESVMNTLVSMQTQRVLFMKMAEDAEGGYADPNLSSEIDRLGKLIEKKHTIEQEGFSLTVTAKQSGEMNMVERIFGDMGNTKTLTTYDQPKQLEQASQEFGFIDAEVIDLPDFGRQ